MRFEFFVALRYLFAKRKEAFISVISTFSILGVGLGVAALIIVLAVMSGFTTDLRDKMLGYSSHVMVFDAGITMHDYHKKEEIAAKVPGVTGVMPFVYSEAMLRGRGGYKGVVLRGIDPQRAQHVLNLGRDMVAGQVVDLERPEGLPGIILGKELADRMGVIVGDTVSLMSPTGKMSAAGFTPSVKIFKVVGLFRSGMFEYDSSLAYVDIPAAQDLWGFKQDLVTGLDIRVNDVYAADDIGQAVLEALGGFPHRVRNWMEMNANLFAALKLEKTAMFVILLLIVLVASFSIVTALVMLVMEKTKDIAILMSMGCTSSSIRRIFMVQGAIIGFTGTLLGFLVGVPISLLLKKYQFIKLPPDVYPMDHLPIRLELPDLALVAVVALVICFVATIYPARQAASLKPADALRHE